MPIFLDLQYAMYIHDHFVLLFFFGVSFEMKLPLPSRIVLAYRKSFYCFGRGDRCDVCDIRPLSSIPTIFLAGKLGK